MLEDIHKLGLSYIKYKNIEEYAYKRIYINSHILGRSEFIKFICALSSSGARIYNFEWPSRRYIRDKEVTQIIKTINISKYYVRNIVFLYKRIQQYSSKLIRKWIHTLYTFPRDEILVCILKIMIKHKIKIDLFAIKYDRYTPKPLDLFKKVIKMGLIEQYMPC